MTDRLTLKLALPVESGEIVGGINTGNSVLISGEHTLLATIDIFETESGMFEPDQSFFGNQAGRKAAAFIVGLFINVSYIDVGST